MKRYILTLACADTRGIVAAVSGFLTEKEGFIIESAQFGDASTDQFFLRMEFEAGPATPDHETLAGEFAAKVGTPFGMDWLLHDKAKKSRVVILVSRYGHCLNDLLHRMSTGTLPIEIPAVISNHPDFQKTVEWHGIPFHYLPGEMGKEKQEKEIRAVLKETHADVAVLARYMQILSPELCAELQGRCINIHHSFLPSFKGARPYHQAYTRGVKLIGATAHYVTNDLDEGPIIEQEVARVDHAQGPDLLASIGRDLESQALARALRYHIEHRVLLNGLKTVIFR